LPDPLPEGWLAVESLDLEAQGVAHRPDGKVVFIEGALPFELVSAQTYRKKNQWEQASLTAIHRPSSQRVPPGCPHFGLHAGACGGCKMQHLHPGAQVAIKQRVLEDNLWHLGKVRPDLVLRPIEGPAWGYRYRARLSVRYVAKKGAVLIGFHERKSRYVADMQVCPVLPAHVSAMLLPLRALVESLDARDSCPQIELACGDTVTALVLRHLQPLSAADLARLRAFAAAQRVQWWLQPKGPDTVHLLDEGGAELAYRLPEFGITMPFRPTDFTQVNPHINRVLVARALRLLDVRSDERVIDWFCGLGNFALPLARQVREVVAVEGVQAMVERAALNAVSNNLHNVQFFQADLSQSLTDAEWTKQGFSAVLLDPPRDGALEVVRKLASLGAKRLVYVSCNPATLARDTVELVKQGYRLKRAGILDMFPQTAHVEAMALFEAG